MSTLWTPEGELPIRREPAPSNPASSNPTFSASSAAASAHADEPSEAELSELRDQLAKTPVEMVIANHAVGMFELAALHLSLEPPQLPQARMAIDAMALLVEGLGERLGSPGRELAAHLSQLRLAFVEAQQAAKPASGG